MSVFRFFVAVPVVSLLAACAAVPPARPAVKSLPPLDASASRVVIASGLRDRGTPQVETLETVSEVGPVYVDGLNVGTTAQNEYVVVDLKPGTHQVSCSPLEPVKNLVEPRRVSFEPGQTKSLVCDMTSARGDLPGKYNSKTYVEQRAIDLQQGAVVGYSKLP